MLSDSSARVQFVIKQRDMHWILAANSLPHDFTAVIDIDLSLGFFCLFVCFVLLLLVVYLVACVRQDSVQVFSKILCFPPGSK